MALPEGEIALSASGKPIVITIFASWGDPREQNSTHQRASRLLITLASMKAPWWQWVQRLGYWAIAVAVGAALYTGNYDHLSPGTWEAGGVFAAFCLMLILWSLTHGGRSE